MNAISTFWIETWGDFNQTITLSLGPSPNGYLGEAYLTLKDGGDYAHVYIAEVCAGGGDEVICGVNDEGTSSSVAFLPSNTLSVTYGLRTTGGHHRAEGAIYVL